MVVIATAVAAAVVSGAFVGSILLVLVGPVDVLEDEHGEEVAGVEVYVGDLVFGVDPVVVIPEARLEVVAHLVAAALEETADEAQEVVVELVVLDHAVEEVDIARVQQLQVLLVHVVVLLPLVQVADVAPHLQPAEAGVHLALERVHHLPDALAAPRIAVRVRHVGYPACVRCNEWTVGGLGSFLIFGCGLFFTDSP